MVAALFGDAQVFLGDLSVEGVEILVEDFQQLGDDGLLALVCVVGVDGGGLDDRLGHLHVAAAAEVGGTQPEHIAHGQIRNCIVQHVLCLGQQLGQMLGRDPLLQACFDNDPLDRHTADVGVGIACTVAQGCQCHLAVQGLLACREVHVVHTDVVVQIDGDAALISQFEPEQTKEILAQMGITVREEGESVPTTRIDRILRDTSSTEFSDPTCTNDTWSMIGEVHNTANLIDLACIAGAIANGGASANPFLVASVFDPNKGEMTYEAEKADLRQLIESTAATRICQIWSDATEKFYRSGKNELDSRISHGKTGTSEIGEGNNRLIMGVLDAYDTAFVVAVEGLPAGNPLMISIANTLAEVIAAGR